MTQAEKDRIAEIIHALRESLKHPKFPKDVRADILAQVEELEGLIEKVEEEVDEDDFA